MPTGKTLPAQNQGQPPARKELVDFLLSLPNTKLDYPFGEEVAVFKVNLKASKKSTSSSAEDDWKMFALVPEKASPVSISLKCDPELAILLREKYETVMAGYHLNKRHWNTMLLTGQVDWLEVKDLIKHSYQLVTGTAS